MYTGVNETPEISAAQSLTSHSGLLCAVCTVSVQAAVLCDVRKTQCTNLRIFRGWTQSAGHQCYVFTSLIKLASPASAHSCRVSRVVPPSFKTCGSSSSDAARRREAVPAGGWW